ncbi:MAG: helix-turn-helix domain-containing protein [Isosphaeraceae bacterium]
MNRKGRKARFPEPDIAKQLAGIRDSRQEAENRQIAAFDRAAEISRLHEEIARINDELQKAGKPELGTSERRLLFRLVEDQGVIAAKAIQEVMARRSQHQAVEVSGQEVPEQKESSSQWEPDAQVADAPVADILANQDWREIIADRIAAESLSLNGLHEETGVSPAVLSRFIRGERDIRVATAQKLCNALDLVLIPREMLDTRSGR